MKKSKLQSAKKWARLLGQPKASHLAIVEQIQSNALESAAQIADDHAADEVKKCCAASIAITIRAMKPKSQCGVCGIEIRSPLAMCKPCENTWWQKLSGKTKKMLNRKFDLKKS